MKRLEDHTVSELRDGMEVQIRQAPGPPFEELHGPAPSRWERRPEGSCGARLPSVGI